MNEIIHLMHLVSIAIGLVGCLIMTYGVAIAFLHFFKVEWLFWGGQQPQSEREALRNQLAYYLLLSLEFLIAADIIDTIIQPGLKELAILGGIIAIRTVISLSLNWELKSKSD